MDARKMDCGSTPGIGDIIHCVDGTIGPLTVSAPMLLADPDWDWDWSRWFRNPWIGGRWRHGAESARMEFDRMGLPFDADICLVPDMGDCICGIAAMSPHPGGHGRLRVCYLMESMLRAVMIRDATSDRDRARDAVTAICEGIHPDGPVVLMDRHWDVRS